MELVGVRRITLFISAIVVTVVVASIMIMLHDMNVDKNETVIGLNENLSANGVKLYMTEIELIQLLGEGEYVEGFGGHQRNYADKKIRIGIAGDQDNDFFGRISLIEISNPNYALYGIKIGDSIDESISRLIELNYKHLVENIYRNGEFVVALHGVTKVDHIQVWFDDKDLRDRNY